MFFTSGGLFSLVAKSNATFAQSDLFSPHANSTMEHLPGPDTNETSDVGDDDSFIVQTFISGWIMLTFCVVGLFGNAMSVIVFRHPTMRAPINVLLFALSLLDMSLSLLAIFVFTLPNFNHALQSEGLTTLYKYTSLCVYPISMIAHSGSIWTFVLIYVERYLAVCQPLNRHKLLTYREAKYAQFVVVLTAFFYNMVRFWEYKLPDEVDANASGTGIEELLRANALYFIFYYTTLYFITHFLVPFSTISILNIAIVRSLRKTSSTLTRTSTDTRCVNAEGKFVPEMIYRRRYSRVNPQHQQRRITHMIIFITVMFVACHFTAFTLNVIEAFYSDLFTGPYRVTAYLVLDISNMLIILNSASNFLVYIAFCRKYRRVFFGYVKLGCWFQRRGNANMERTRSVYSARYWSCTLNGNVANGMAVQHDNMDNHNGTGESANILANGNIAFTKATDAEQMTALLPCSTV